MQQAFYFYAFLFLCVPIIFVRLFADRIVCFANTNYLMKRQVTDMKEITLESHARRVNKVLLFISGHIFCVYSFRNDYHCTYFPDQY